MIDSPLLTHEHDEKYAPEDSSGKNHDEKSLEVALFIEFPGIEKLETQILKRSGQTGTNLTAQNNWVNL